MAKRKLSLQQRKTIRREIRQLIAQKKKQADILRAMADKYGIKTVTARWYYKSIVKTGKNQAVRRTSARGGVRLANGASLRLVHQVQSIADRNLKRVLEAKKLIPKWQLYVKKEAALKKLENKVRSDLRAASTMASELHRKIRALTSG